MCQGSTDCSSEKSSFLTKPAPISTHAHVEPPMGVMMGASSLGEMGVMRHIPHYASTPHLFVYQAAEEEEEEEEEEEDRVDGNVVAKEPIYSSAIDIRKATANKEAEAVRRIHEKYDSLRNLTEKRDGGGGDEVLLDDPHLVTEEDVNRMEMFFRGHKTQVWVCRTMANLYSEGGPTGPAWDLKFTGVPLLILDQGHTKSRNKKQIQIILAEKGTGFALWKDVIDNLTAYKTQEPHFHTLYLSSDHRRRMGLSFNEARAAMEFYSHLERLISDPSNIALSGPGKKKRFKDKLPKYKAPRKSDISLPCNFQHVTSVDACDKGRLFSLQIFSKFRSSQQQQQPPHTVIDKPPQNATNTLNNNKNKENRENNNKPAPKSPPTVAENNLKNNSSSQIAIVTKM
ncbi:uncharacterized protein LOC143041191 [Oratosquilla oratoria]|uniref:uncharacterized protein LOC143041191 n=1 Tax=Oratosquilla oratoria TaxID=337810 RepID=UPI003F76BC95